MARDVDNDYYYDTGTVNEELDNFQIYEKNGELHLHDKRTDDVVKVQANGNLKSPSHEVDSISGREQVSGGGDETDITDAIDRLPSGRTRWGVVQVNGDYDINSQISIPSYTYLDLRGAKLTLQTTISTGGMLDYDEGQQIYVVGGVLDGNKSNLGGSSTGVRVLDSSPPESGDFDDSDNALLYTQIRDFNGNGVLATSRRATYLRVDVNNCGSNAFQVKGSDQSFIRCRGEANGGNGFRVQGGFNHFWHCIADESGVRGLLFTSGGDNNVVVGGYAEFADNEGVKINDGAVENRISQVTLINNGQVNASPAVTVEGDRNRIHNCTMYDDQSTTTQDEAVKITSTGQKNSVWNNDYEENPLDYLDNGDRNKFEGRVEDTYTGDGTQNRRIVLGFRPSVVYVEEGGGTLFEVRDDGLATINGSSPTGELSIQDDGFEVGDNGGDADPNTNNETYTFVAIE